MAEQKLGVWGAAGWRAGQVRQDIEGPGMRAAGRCLPTLGIPRATLSRIRISTSSTMRDFTALCYCTPHPQPTLMTLLSPPMWTKALVRVPPRVCRQPSPSGSALWKGLLRLCQRFFTLAGSYVLKKPEPDCPCRQGPPKPPPHTPLILCLGEAACVVSLAAVLPSLPLPTAY